MKYLAAILLPLIMLAFAGCGEDYYGDPHYYHALKVRVIDDTGNNKVKGIELRDNGAYSTIVLSIAPDLYDLRLKKGEEEEIQSNWLSYVLINNEEFLNFDECTLFNPYPIMTHYFRCERIFGDDLEHEIAAYYSTKKRIPRLKKVTFDGVEQKIYEGDLVTVTIKRQDR